MNFLVKSLIIATSLLMMSCETAEDNDIAKALDCLDKANSTTAQACYEMAARYESAQAYEVRCSALFVTEGYGEPDKFQSAFEAMKSPETQSSGSPMLGMLGVLTVKDGSNAPNPTKAEQIFRECKATGLSGMIMFASLVNVATTLAEMGRLAAVITQVGTDGLTPEQMKDILAASTNASDETLGASVIAAQSAYCTGSNAESEMCADLNAAVQNGGGDADAIGFAVRCQLAAKDALPPGCPTVP